MLEATKGFHAIDELAAVTRTVRRCLVCGSRELRTDEVEDHGWVLLTECPHCDHRWTQRLEPCAQPRPPVLREAPAPRGPLRVCRPTEVAGVA